jgi:hypothetical protein
MRRLIPILLLIVALIALVQPQPARAYVVASSWPVVLVHGFSSTSSDDCQAEFPQVKAYLAAHNWTGGVISVGYYSADTNCDTSIVNWSALHDPIDHCALDYEVAGMDGTNNEDLRHVACELDWYLYDNWWVHGWNVDLVAHSMGGLIARWGMAASGGSLPTVRYTQDIFTAGTPHEGLAQILPCGCVQAQEMFTTDPFIQALQTSGQNPQGTAGTTWTMIGSYCDGTTAIGMDGGHKVRYHTPCYLHGSYFQDLDGVNGAVVDESIDQPRDVVNVASGTWPHSLHYLTETLEGQTH